MRPPISELPGCLTTTARGTSTKARRLSQWEAFSVLELPESQRPFPIHLEADDQLLVDTLAVFVADGSMTQQELDGIVGAY